MAGASLDQAKPNIPDPPAWESVVKVENPLSRGGHTHTHTTGTVGKIWMNPYPLSRHALFPLLSPIHPFLAPPKLKIAPRGQSTSRRKHFVGGDRPTSTRGSGALGCRPSCV